MGAGVRWMRAGIRGSGLTAVAVVLASAGPAVGQAWAASGITYVARAASGTSATPSTGAHLTVNHAVAAGDALIVELLLSTTSPLSGVVSMTDSAGNAYHVDRDQNDDGDGDRTLVLSALNVRALPAGAQVTLAFPQSNEYHVSVDEFAGIAAVDTGASAWGRIASFSSGATTTSQPAELLFGAVGSESGGVPVYSSGWISLPVLSVASDRAAAAYQVTSAAGQFAATGSVNATWMAAIVAYVASGGPPTDSPPVARVSVSPTSGPAPLAVTADASGSTDGDATPIASYRFSFGDGSAAVVTTAPTATAQHTYTAAGTFTVSVTATDTAGNVSTPATATVTATPAGGPSVAVYAGYYDTHHANTQPKPDPWQGSANVVFVGQPDSSSGGWDSSAVRVDNLTGSALTGVVVTVDVGSDHFALWGTNTIPAGASLIVTQMGNATFDGSDLNPAGCFDCDPSLCTTDVLSTRPVVHVTVSGRTTDIVDTGQILNTHGVDSAGCPFTGTRNDESEAWQRIG